MKANSLFVLCSLVAVFIAGCASPTQTANMVSAPLGLEKKHEQTVFVQAGGGEPTNPLWMSKVSNEDLVTAIQTSIKSNGLFSGLVQLGDADYVLDATIVSLSQPTMGFNMTVNIEIVWTLTPKGASKPVWEKSIKGTATKGMSDATMGIKRLRLTTEAAVRECITQAMTQISALELK